MQTQSYSHPISSFPTTYTTGSPVIDLPYQYPGFISPSLPNTQSLPRYPAGLMPGTNNNMFVTSGPNYQPPTLSNAHTHSQNSLSAVHLNQGSSVQQHKLQGYSQIEYIPYESYYIDYEERQFVQNVLVPVQRRVTDYYAVEHVVDYVPREIEETVIDMVPTEKITQKLMYVPVETQVVHLPKETQYHHTNTHTHVQQHVHQQQLQTVETVQSGKQYIVSRPVQSIGGALSHGIGQVRPSSNQQVIVSQPVPQVVQRPQTIIQHQNQQVPQPPQLIGQRIAQGSGARVPVQPIQVNPQFANQLNQVPIPMQQRPPVVAGNQFTQSRTTIQRNQTELQKKMSLPDNTNVQYQYSTKTVRNLSPEEARRLSPPKGELQRLQGQQQQTVINSVPVARQPTAQLNTQPPQQPQQQPPQSSLSSNPPVDLADSEHIAITKSVYNATYNQQNQLPLAQGAPTGTNPNIYTSNQNNPNTYSFGSSSNNQSFDTNVNRSSAQFNSLQANRTSAGSVFDYDRNREY